MSSVATTQKPSSSEYSRCTYHVFLSFRGEDTRKNFTDHLYYALDQSGIHTFRDDDEIQRGQTIKTELHNAIKQSKVSIIVLSQNYASSSWCLDELLMILEKRRTSHGQHTVIPVFYGVDPSDVRKQTGSFAKAFARHEKRLEDERDKLEMWRTALKQVADLAGMALNNRHESNFIQDIVREVLKKLDRQILNVPTHLVGRDSTVADIDTWLKDDSTHLGIAIIYGVGGIGKTTIAKDVYNRNFMRFDGSSFLANIRDAAREPNGLICIQRQLLSDLLKRTNEVISVNEGIQKVKAAICCRKVLIILDDVHDIDQLNDIIGQLEGLYQGSKVVVTTRFPNLLGASKVCKKLEVKELDGKESLELLSWHAFGQEHPFKDYIECSKKVVQYCGGLPLALQVLGSSLCGKNIDVWESALQKLKAIPDRKIYNILRISYDSLPDDHDKSLFLDIAWFFVGEDKDYTVEILNGCGYYTKIGIENLIDRCLLTINTNGKVSMHQLIRDMGREIVRRESVDDPGERSRLWNDKEAVTVLNNKTGTKSIKGITLDIRKLTVDEPGNLVVNLEANTFQRMQKLKLLQLNCVNLHGDYEHFPKNLIWLCWHEFPLKYVPTEFLLEKLVSLDLSYSSFEHVWKGTMSLRALKFLNVSHCHQLIRTPDFSGTTCLESLIMEDCINLVMVDESIGNLERLVFLNLNFCKSLKKLPQKINMLKSLEKLNLYDCSELVELPEDLKRMESLKVVDLGGVDINQLVFTGRDVKGLGQLLTTSGNLKFKSWPSLRKSPLSFFPRSLTELSLIGCNLSDDAIFCGLSGLHYLKSLNLCRNPFCYLPKSIGSLAMLKTLDLAYCTNLQFIHELPSNLLLLFLSDCESLEKVPTFENLSWSMKSGNFSGTLKLVEAEGIFKIEPITNIDPTVIESLGLYKSESLERIKVKLRNNYTRHFEETPLKVLHEYGISCVLLQGSRVQNCIQLLHECIIYSNFFRGRKVPNFIQVAHECCSSVFLPGSKVPNCFSIKEGSSTSFFVPSTPGFKIRALNLCVLYTRRPIGRSSGRRFINIINKNKQISWGYEPVWFGVPDKDMIWLSYWNLCGKLEVGDEIVIKLRLLSHEHVILCGTKLVWEHNTPI